MASVNGTYQVGTDLLPDRQARAREELGRYLSRSERACVFKVQHTQQSAEFETRRLHALGEDRAKPYRCELCKHWHVGRRTKEQQARKGKKQC